MPAVQPWLYSNMPAIRGAVLDQIGVPRPYWRSKPISVVELHLDPPDRGEVLVRIEAAGVCHSDLSVVDGTRVRPVPILLGHEAAGIVEQVGDGVDGVAVGQRVVLVFLPRCGQCAACATDGRTPCEPGSAANKAGTLLGGGIRLSRGGRPVYHHLGVSGFATHVVVNRASVVPVPHEVPPTVAALLGCAVLTGGGAVLNVGDPQPGQSVAVVGLGGVGMAAVLTALTYTDVRVVAVDQLPESCRPQRPWAPMRSTHRSRPRPAGSKPPWLSKPSVILPRCTPRSGLPRPEGAPSPSGCRHRMSGSACRRWILSPKAGH